ncbi:MAG: VWA domain-containing protein, partial [Endomicrobium sp.]|nr:VWA domain-containing protein [Endomicrobium sp.]
MNTIDKETKSTDLEVIKRFQKFDFDPKGNAQKEIYEKISVLSARKKSKRLFFTYAFPTAFGILIAVFMAVNFPYVQIKRAAKIQSESRILKGAKPDRKKDAYLSSSAINSKPEAAVWENEDNTVGNHAYLKAQKNEEVKISYKEEMRANAYPSSTINKQISKDETKILGAAPLAKRKAQENYMRQETQTEEKAALSDNFDAHSSYDAMQDKSYKKYGENSFCSTLSNPLSTFSADVDAASYNIARRVIASGKMPEPDSVRIEEFLNYFNYSYPQPEKGEPVSIHFEYTDSPWNKGLKLVKIGLKAKDIEKEDFPPSNLVFLIDVSVSMSSENRLPLVKKSLKMLVDELRPQDLVSIVIYASGVEEVLSVAKGSEKEKIKGIIDSIATGKGTSGSAGLNAAYQTAKKNFIKKGNNRVILATDGDFNIGAHSESELENQITQARSAGIFLSVLGYGMGNYKDSKVQTLANKGNGNYAYINDIFEARKTLVKEFGATLFTVAKDVKIQVEFNPEFASAYRLIGYEKRALNTQDFNNDAKGAGEIGAGHTVT